MRNQDDYKTPRESIMMCDFLDYAQSDDDVSWLRIIGDGLVFIGLIAVILFFFIIATI